MGLELCLPGPEGSKIRTNPSRDIVYFWPDILERAKEGLFKKNWEPWYASYLKEKKVDEEELLECHAALVTALCATNLPELDHPYKGLQASGFFQCNPAAQLVVMAKVGQIGSMAFWAGIRSALPKDEMPNQLAAMIRDAEMTRTALGATRKKKGKKQ
jgi:hypothetical protein